MKKLEIKLKEYDDEITCLCTDDEKVTISAEEYPEIYEKANEISWLDEDDFQEAIDIILGYMMKNELYKTEINLDKRNESYTPIKEMTLDEIEKELGCKVKIVKKKED